MSVVLLGARFSARFNDIPILERGSIVQVFRNMDDFGGKILQISKPSRGEHFDGEDDEELNGHQDEEDTNVLHNSKSCIEGNLWSLWILRICIVPSVQLFPVDGLVEAVQVDDVIGGLIQFSSFGLLQSGFEWDLLSLEVVEDVEESKAGGEEGDHGDDSSEDTHERPEDDGEFGFHQDEDFLAQHQVYVREDCTFQTE